MRMLSELRNVEWVAGLRLAVIVIAGIFIAAGWALVRGDGTLRNRLGAGLAAATLPLILVWPGFARSRLRRRRPSPDAGPAGLAAGSLEGLEFLRRVGAI